MTTFVDSAWDGSASGYGSSEDFCSACLIDLNKPGEKKTQDNCKLPVKDKSGAVNKNAVHSAAAALAGGRGGINAPSAEKKKAARALVRYYGQMKEDAPDSLKNMAM